MYSKPPPQLAAIHKLEFYKKISKWSFTREETPSDDSPNLNGTYDVLPALTVSQECRDPDDEEHQVYMETEPLLSSSLHKASLESLESECSFMSRADLVPHSSRAELRARNMTEGYVCEPPSEDVWRPGELTRLLSLPSGHLLRQAQWEVQTAHRHARRHHALLAVCKAREEHDTSLYQSQSHTESHVVQQDVPPPHGRPMSAPLSNTEKRIVIVGGRPYTF